MTPTEALASLNLSIRSEFIPFSLSRNNGKTKGRDAFPSLNWRVTLLKGDREILTTDYSAGIGQCPAQKLKAPTGFHGNDHVFQRMASAWEIENGHVAQWHYGDDFKAKRQPATQEQRDAGLREMVRIPILPKPEDVWASMIMEIVDEPFEDWASSLGFNSDSIKDKAIYDLCVEHTMKLRQWLGNAGIETLREAFQDY